MPIVADVTIKVAMLPVLESAGWAARMHQAGFRVGSRLEPFGRQTHSIRCGRTGAALILNQGFKQETRNEFTNLTPDQYGILKAMETEGALSGAVPLKPFSSVTPDATCIAPGTRRSKAHP